MSLEAEYTALRDGFGAVRSRRDVVTATGSDATDFLQGQLSQDLASIAVGESAASLLLQPQGKMEALLRLTRLADNHWLIDVPTGWGDPVMARLERFKLRTACDLSVREVGALLMRGPRSVGAGDTGAEISAPVDWAGLGGRDLVGDNLSIPAEATVCSPAALEVVRIEAGVAAMGSEIDENTIPAEANVVDAAVSFTKGCFTGQELVARIDSRGSNTPRRLRGLVFDAEAQAPGTDSSLLDDGGKDVGRLTSVAYSPGYGAAVALAYIGRAVEPGSSVSAAGAGAEVRELPFFA